MTKIATPTKSDTLYHYSPLIHLPVILREGLSKGDIAHTDPTVRVAAVSLTTQTDPDRLWCWGPTPFPFKTAVRYTCRVPDASRLEPARDLWRRLGLGRDEVKHLDPYGQSKWWSTYHGVISPRHFSVEIRGRGGYVPLAGDALGRVSSAVLAVRRQLDFLSPLGEPSIQLVRPRPGANPEVVETYLTVAFAAELLAEEHGLQTAERFAAV